MERYRGLALGCSVLTMSPVSEYHLQARRAVRGSCPRREETRLTDTDCLDDALTEADGLAGDGFTVWVFRRTARPQLTAAPGPLHLVTTITPACTGRPVRRPPVGEDALAARRR
jgi:hypothetical protein